MCAYRQRPERVSDLHGGGLTGSGAMACDTRRVLILQKGKQMHTSVISKMHSSKRATVLGGVERSTLARGHRLFQASGLTMTRSLARQKLNFKEICIFLAYFLADFCYVSASSSGKVQCQVHM